MSKYFLVIVIILTITGCADTVTFNQAASIEPVGFWYGLWHGVTFPFAFFGSLIWDDISIYAIYNNGGWYDFGFWFGACCIGGGAGSSSNKE